MKLDDWYLPKFKTEDVQLIYVSLFVILHFPRNTSSHRVFYVLIISAQIKIYETTQTSYFGVNLEYLQWYFPTCLHFHLQHIFAQTEVGINFWHNL